MKKTGLFLPILIIIMMTLASSNYAFAQENTLVVRIARLRIDSTQLEQYEAALKEEIETAVRVEPGVLTLYAVAQKNDPASITVFEIYADQDAYQAHLETPHFKKYKSITKGMVQSLELTEEAPIALGAKKK